MKKLAFLFVATMFSVASFAQTKYNVDSYHSFLNFSVGHMGISFVDGKMDKYDGTLELDGENITTAKFNFKIDANSINTGIEMRDNHLRAADFFDVANHKDITFTSTSIKKKGKGYKLNGNLTMKGITKPVTFDLVYGGLVKDDGQGNQKVGFQATTTIDRTAFGINYDPTGTGIAKDVKFTVNLEFNKAK